MDPDNVSMIEAWDGAVGQHWVAEQTRYERMHAPFGRALLAAAGLRPGMRVLDIGCGTGARTIDAAASVGPRGRAVGVDVSAAMLEVARADSLARARFIHADVQSTQDLGHEEYDVALSQFGMAYFADTHAALINIATALRPGGRLHFTCWQNMAHQQHLTLPLRAALEHLPMPEFATDPCVTAAFSLADPDRTHAQLSNAGFTDIDIQPTVTPMYQGADLDDALRFLRSNEFGATVFASAGPAAAAQSWELIATTLAPYVRHDGLFLDGAAWLVAATRA